MGAIISYEKMMELCKEAYPLLTWGNTDDGNICCSCISLIDENLSFHLRDEEKFNEYIDKIWNDKNKSLYLWSRKTIFEYIAKVMRYIHVSEKDTDINDLELRSQWGKLVSSPSKQYTVIHPIFGISPVNEIICVNPFKIYNIHIHKQDIISNTKVPVHQFGRISGEFKESDNYLALPICANEPFRAMEKARIWFELFEYIAKFCLHNSDDYDIGVFNYKKRGSLDGYILSSEGQFSSFASTGVINKVCMSELVSNTKPVWSLLEKYFNGQCTDIENRIIRGIRWIGIANNSEYDATKYIQYIFAIESILSHKSAGEIITPSIAHKLAEGSAHIIGERTNVNIISKKDLKQKIFSDVKHIYSNRSKIVHGSDEKLSHSDVVLSCRISYLLIQSLLASEELLKMTSMSQLDKWLDERKFS